MKINMIKVDQKAGSKSQDDQERQKGSVVFVSESFCFYTWKFQKQKSTPKPSMIPVKTNSKQKYLLMVQKSG